MLLKKLAQFYNHLNVDSIGEHRTIVLQPLIDFIQQKMNNEDEIRLNFICTHNSRRSQMAQLWAQTAAYANQIKVQTYSGGVEVTAFHPNAIDALTRAGFEIYLEGINNPNYTVTYSSDALPLVMYSKLFDDEVNPSTNFAAIMTCSHADETCPFIPGTDQRIAITYDDPKAFDGTKLETLKYDERSLQIATEMKYVFSQINHQSNE